VVLFIALNFGGFLRDVVCTIYCKVCK